MTIHSMKTLNPSDEQMHPPLGHGQGDADTIEGQRLQESVEELSFYLNPQAKAKLSYLILGVDTSRQPVRMIVASASYDHGRDDMAVCPHEAAEFTSLSEFVSSWTSWSRRGVHVAVPSEDADPLGIRHWLECTREPVERYDWWSYQAHLRNDLTLKDVGIDSRFRRAYVLALYSGYRLHASVVCRSIWGRLLEAHYLLDDVRRDAHRLSAALDPLPVTMDEIPF